MKKIFTLIIVVVLFAASAWAQSPASISYQAVVRNTGNELVADQTIGVQISILQGSIAGSSVYTESHAPATNANGLMTLEIGKGEVISGQFSAINWASGSYFVKTEIDPAGGTSYSITGVSQLMSVPYALHAKTAETLSGEVNYTERDPEFTKSLAYGITATDTAQWNKTTIDTKLSESEVDAFVANNGYLTAEVDGSTTNEIQSLSLAGKTLTISGGNSVDLTNIANPTSYAVGDQLYGGIVFYVDQSGQHGLICAKEDQSSGMAWQFGSAVITGAQSLGIGGGYMNTMLIIAAQRGDYEDNYAAKKCAFYYTYINSTTYGGWYLPNIEELQLIQSNQAAINTTAATMGGSDLNGVEYWTSREGGATTAGSAQTVYMQGGTGGRTKTDLKAVRAIRAF